MTPQPLTDEQQLVARIAEAIRPRMLIGLQDAELYDEPGAERINEWADSIAGWAAEVVQPGVDRLRAELEQARAERTERTQFAVDTAADLERAKGHLAEALRILDDGPQWVNDRVQQHWSVPATRAAEILRGALNPTT